jgi:hypothetical protein
VTPEELLPKVRAAALAAFPDRAPSLLRAVERLFWGDPHPPGLPEPHCRWCCRFERLEYGTGRPRPGSPRLFAGKVCDRCVTIAHDVLVERRVGRPEPPFELAVAEAIRALRATDAPAEAIEELERRAAPVTDPPHACRGCGPRTPWPRAAKDDDACLLCDRPAADGVLGPPRGLCAKCVELCNRALR